MSDHAVDCAVRFLSTLSCNCKREAIDIVFDGPPGHESGRFVEVERDGRSASVGEWLQREDGFWVLRIPRDPSADRARLAVELAEAWDLRCNAKKKMLVHDQVCEERCAECQIIEDDFDRAMKRFTAAEQAWRARGEGA